MVEKIEFELIISIPSINHIYATNKQGYRFITTQGKKFKEDVGFRAKQEIFSKTLSRDLPLWNNKEKLEVELNLCFCRHGRDLDNACKLIIDSLQGIVFTNDKQIYQLLVFKNDDNIKRDSFSIKIMNKEKMEVKAIA